MELGVDIRKSTIHQLMVMSDDYDLTEWEGDNIPEDADFISECPESLRKWFMLLAGMRAVRDEGQRLGDNYRLLTDLFLREFLFFCRTKSKTKRQLVLYTDECLMSKTWQVYIER